MVRKPTEIRKTEIIQGAWELILDEGVQGLTIKNICRKIAVSEAAIYRHFTGKHAILMGMIDNFEKNLMKAIEDPIRHRSDPMERLKDIMRTHLVFTQEEKGPLFAITAESIHFNDDGLRQKILEVMEKYRAKIKGILKEAKNKNMLQEGINLDAASLTFFGLIQAAIIQYALTNYTIPPITRFNALWNIFLRGVEKVHF